MSSDSLGLGFVLTIISLVANLVVLAVLYPLLPKGSRCGQLRFIVRFAAIWGLGGLGVIWGYENNQRVIMVMSDIVVLVGMVTSSALWPHLAWLMALDEREQKANRSMENIQTVIYTACIVFILLGILTNDGTRFLPHPYIHAFQVWFLVMLMFSIVKLVGKGWRDAPDLERTSRTLVGAAATLMFLFVVNDLILGLMVATRVEVTVYLLPMATALAGSGFIIKRRFLVEAERLTMRKEPSRYALRPGKVYYDMSRPKATGPEVARGQVSRGRVVVVLTGRDEVTVRDRAGLDRLMVKRFSYRSKVRGYIDPSSPADLQMVPWIARELGVEANEVKDAEGAVLIIEDLHNIAKAAGRKASRELLKELKASVQGSDTVRLVLIGDRKRLGSLAKTVERIGFPLHSEA